jgi:hypothetical protein
VGDADDKARSSISSSSPPKSETLQGAERRDKHKGSNWIAALLSILLPMAVKPELWESVIVGGTSVLQRKV